MPTRCNAVFRRLFPIALGCLLCAPAAALEPCSVDPQYVGAIDEMVDAAVGQPATVALTVLPSFHDEYGLRIVGQEVHLVRIHPQFWTSSILKGPKGRYIFDFRKSRVRRIVHRASLDPELVRGIQHAYTTALSTEQDPEAAGHDGTTYRFVVRDVGCGQAWSPRPASVSGQLVALADLLAAHAKLSSPSSLRRSEDKIRRALAGKTWRPD